MDRFLSYLKHSQLVLHQMYNAWLRLGYFTQYNKYEYNSNITLKITRHYHLFPKIRGYSTHNAGTAERNLEGRGAWLRTEGVIHLEGAEWIGLGKF